jgi:hypothetical protein
MSRTVRWLHLSDFHVGMDEYAGRKLFQYIHAHVKERRDAGFVPDLIFVSGDLANKGRAQEYNEFWWEFALPLLERVGLDENRLFVVPGNHDVQRGENSAIDRAQLAEPTSRYFDPTPEGQKLRRWILPRFASYLDADLSKGANGFRDVAGSYATNIEIQGARIGIAGINTAWLSKDDEDREKLSPGAPLLQAALEELVETDLTIVVGHHPISWLVEAQQKPIKALLAKRSALYLHGHLHNAWSEPTYGGPDHFLAIQSGAAFQARDGEKWRNGLVWGQVNLSDELVRLQARCWNPVNQDWPLIGDAYPEDLREDDWWVYPTPGSEKARRVAAREARRRPKAPAGWEFLESDDFVKWDAPLGDADAIGFFNGAVPTWRIAMSSSVPQRAVVKSLIREVLSAAENAGKPSVTLLLGAGGEGKTTALLQAAGGVAASGGWRIAHRVDDAAALPTDLLDSPLQADGRWLLVVDEADVVGPALWNLLSALPDQLGPRVHALITCRDSDWVSSDASALNWPSVCRFARKIVEGLEEADATAIVEAWTAFGDAGLGQLERVAKQARVATLVDSAQDEMTKGVREAFFGALLAARHGTDLQSHVRLLLERLGSRTIGGDRTRRDAFAFAAAMHAEGFSFLSRAVLAQVLDCPPEQLHQRVIFPLGREAAATSTSTFVLTRHRRIAEEAVRLLDDEFGVDVGAVFVDLAAAAIDARHGGSFVPYLAGWRYDLPGHFMSTGRPELAIAIARTVVDHDPEDLLVRVNLACLLRQAGEPALGAELLRASATDAIDFRGYYTEWGTCEAVGDDAKSGVALLAYSISDQLPQRTLSLEDLQVVLNNLGLQFRLLHEQTGDEAFRDALIATAVIGAQFPEAPKSYLEEYIRYGQDHGGMPCAISDAFDLLSLGVVLAASEVVIEPFSAFTWATGSLTFQAVRRMAENAATHRSR